MNSTIFSSDRLPFLTAVILYSRITWSIRLRWLAIAGFLAASFISSYTFELNVPLHSIIAVLSILAAVNLIYYIILRIVRDFSVQAELIFLTVHIIIDLFFLTLLVHYSGGIESPVFIFYIFHVVLSSIVYPRRIPLAFATFVVLLFSAHVSAEYYGLIDHYGLYNTSLHSNGSFIVLILTVFAITVYVTTYICTTFMHIYRESKRIIDLQNQQLLEADRQKTKFFQFASHELKSPIIAIKSTLDGVIKTYADQIDGKALGLLRRASLRSSQMLEIIKELLELSRNRGIHRRSNAVPIAVCEVLNNVIEQETAAAQARQICIEKELDCEHVLVMGVQSDLQKIFQNLINNAVRYTNNNGKVIVRASRRDNALEVQITDTGIGIAADETEKIFTEFYRAENARKLVNFGTGLGLSLVKQLLELHGGSITVASQLNQGTTFTVTLPIEKRRDN